MKEYYTKDHFKKLTVIKENITLQGVFHKNIALEIELVQQGVRAHIKQMNKVAKAVLLFLDGKCEMEAIEQSGLLGVSYFDYEKHRNVLIIIVGTGKYQYTFLIDIKK